MGWLDFIFGEDVTEMWAESVRLEPVLDLRDWSLCGLKLGEAGERLERFGKPENKRPFREGVFYYGQSGVLVEVDADRVIYFGISLDDDPIDSLKGNTGRLIRQDGMTIDLNDGTTLDAVQEFLGVEPEKDVDEDEIVAAFTVDGHYVEVEAQLDGKVKRVNLFRVTQYRD